MASSEAKLRFYISRILIYGREAQLHVFIFVSLEKHILGNLSKKRIGNFTRKG